MLVHKCNTQHQQNLVQHVIPLFCCSLWWLFIYLFFQNLLPWWHPSNYFNDLTRHLHCYLPQPSTAWKRKWNEKQEEFYGSVCLHLPTCKCNQKWIKISFNLMSDVEHFRAMAPKWLVRHDKPCLLIFIHWMLVTVGYFVSRIFVVFFFFLIQAKAAF